MYARRWCKNDKSNHVNLFTYNIRVRLRDDSMPMLVSLMDYFCTSAGFFHRARNNFYFSIKHTSHKCPALTLLSLFYMLSSSRYNVEVIVGEKKLPSNGIDFHKRRSGIRLKNLCVSSTFWQIMNAMTPLNVIKKRWCSDFWRIFSTIR